MIPYTLAARMEGPWGKWRVAQELRRRGVRYCDPAAERVRGSGAGLAGRNPTAHRLCARWPGISADDSRPASRSRARFRGTNVSITWSCCGEPESSMRCPPAEQIRLGGAAAARAAGLARVRGVRIARCDRRQSGSSVRNGKAMAAGAVRRSRRATRPPGRVVRIQRRTRVMREYRRRSSGRGIPVHNFAGETTLGEYIELAAACRRRT